MTDFGKRLLFIDAVRWSEAYAPGHRLRAPSSWFDPLVSSVPGATMRCLSAEESLDGEPAEDVDGVIVSGSPLDAWDEDPVNHRLMTLIHRCRESRIPLLGVCYGHQILGRALGGQVARHPKGWELGNVDIQLTAEGLESPLFRGVGHKFSALQSHADAVLDLPPGCRLLAGGAHTTVQAFSWDNLLYGVQFHPETTPEILRYLWSPRLDVWRGKIGFDIDERYQSFEPAPEARKVIPNFIQHLIP